ncbi:hypothetical protein AYL99_11967 [Fonsecaea erecta]|uniref:Uncharacterized protein n=1 Tax=Fonsecaea erecta TaxID=1367422 RepID=A0A178Z2B5_9EURO|nr:hypothetical protein AYL99_11967 [Fonsecaea erecta]OAP53844.1 hypothetical protein AYL99_11967 [Fonsecaea erecta]
MSNPTNRTITLFDMPHQTPDADADAVPSTKWNETADAAPAMRSTRGRAIRSNRFKHFRVSHQAGRGHGRRASHQEEIADAVLPMKREGTAHAVSPIKQEGTANAIPPSLPLTDFQQEEPAPLNPQDIIQRVTTNSSSPGVDATMDISSAPTREEQRQGWISEAIERIERIQRLGRMSEAVEQVERIQRLPVGDTLLYGEIQELVTVMRRLEREILLSISSRLGRLQAQQQQQQLYRNDEGSFNNNRKMMEWLQTMNLIVLHILESRCSEWVQRE